MGFGFFTCRFGSVTSNEGFEISAFDASTNFLDISQGFLTNSGGCSFYGPSLNDYASRTIEPYSNTFRSTPNETFKFQKSTGASSFSFRMGISAVNVMLVTTNSVLYIFEMD